jgi:hypothetical protein
VSERSDELFRITQLFAVSFAWKWIDAFAMR